MHLLIQSTSALPSCQIAERFINTAKATKPVLAFAGPLVSTSRPQDSQDGFFCLDFWFSPQGQDRRRI